MTTHAQSTIGKLDPPARKESPPAKMPRGLQVQRGEEKSRKRLFTHPVPNLVFTFQETYLPQGRGMK
jgi:hypothetical protein